MARTQILYVTKIAGCIFMNDMWRPLCFYGLMGPELIPEIKTECFAWSLMSNHVHLLLKTGLVPVSFTILDAADWILPVASGAVCLLIYECWKKRKPSKQ
jgi:hypothetical protein